MPVKNNEEKAVAFLNKYAEYKNNGELLVEMIASQSDLQKQEKSEFEIKRLTLEYEKIMDKSRKLEAEIIKELKRFSQELLITIYKLTENSGIKELVKSQIRSNDITIEELNNIKLESGVIFEDLDNMSKERKLDLLKLRETEDDLEIDGTSLLKLSPVVRGYIFKSITSDLEEEKRKFMEEHGFKSEQEFEFFKETMMKKEGRRIAEEVEKNIYQIFGIEDSSFIDEMEEKLNEVANKKH